MHDHRFILPSACEVDYRNLITDEGSETPRGCTTRPRTHSRRMAMPELLLISYDPKSRLFSLPQNSIHIRRSWWIAHVCSRVIIQNSGDLLLQVRQRGCGKHSFSYKLLTLSCESFTSGEMVQQRGQQRSKGMG